VEKMDNLKSAVLKGADQVVLPNWGYVCRFERGVLVNVVTKRRFKRYTLHRYDKGYSNHTVELPRGWFKALY
jgi:hypothetical protein